MDTAIGIATPVRESDRARMRARIGRDHFYFQGAPTVCVVNTRIGGVPSLRWEFNQIDPILRTFMTLEQSRKQKITLKEADAFLTRTGAFFIQADYAIRYTDQLPEEWSALHSPEEEPL